MGCGDAATGGESAQTSASQNEKLSQATKEQPTKQLQQGLKTPADHTLKVSDVVVNKKVAET